MTNLKVSQNLKQSIINFDDYYNCLFAGNYRKECENFIIKSMNHDMFLQKVTKNSLSAFEEKRCYLNETESLPWN